jgi:hypothetical protein
MPSAKKVTTLHKEQVRTCNNVVLLLMFLSRDFWTDWASAVYQQAFFALIGPSQRAELVSAANSTEKHYNRHSAIIWTFCCWTADQIHCAFRRTDHVQKEVRKFTHIITVLVRSLNLTLELWPFTSANGAYLRSQMKVRLFSCNEGAFLSSAPDRDEWPNFTLRLLYQHVESEVSVECDAGDPRAVAPAVSVSQ